MCCEGRRVLFTNLAKLDYEGDIEEFSFNINHVNKRQYSNLTLWNSIGVMYSTMHRLKL